MTVTTRLAVTPATTLLDEKFTVRLSGLPPGAAVTLRSGLRDDQGKLWSAAATFTAPADGVLDTGRDAPTSGSYSGVDPTGLLWSMTVEAAGRGKRTTFGADLRPYTITIGAEIGGETIATGRAERLPLAPGVVRREVRDAGLYGTLFMPPGAGPHPAAIIVGGSGGGLSEGSSALLASRGVAAFALAYFGAGPLNPDLTNIPLEYFGTAIDWLLAQPGVAGEKVGFMGTSRGGELSLLVGATFPKIGAVVANVPSSVVYPGLTRAPLPEGVVMPSWLWRGEPVTHMPTSRRPAGDLPAPPAADGGIPLTPGFLRTLENAAAVEAATIPVERIGGPVLLIGGEDDQMWPSALFARRVADRLKAHNHPHPDRLVTYPNVGHLIGPPGLPTTQTASLHPVTGGVFTFGGQPAAVAAAQFDAWPQVVAHFQTALAAPLLA